MIIKFRVTGDPRPKARPRLGKYGNVYTPKQTLKAEQEFLKQAIPHRPVQPIDKPVRIELKFIKKKVYGKDRSKVFADRRPDLDNYIKLAIDALDAWFWTDDSRIVEIKASKLYGQKPRTEVMIEVLE